jgi:hypothetical protein
VRGGDVWIKSDNWWEKNIMYILERELKEEGWLCENEDLMVVLASEERLRDHQIGEENEEDAESSNFGLFPDDWTEEDFKANGF